jgi:magnesium transporter
VGADITFILTGRSLVTIRYADPLAFRNFEARCVRQPDACGSPEHVFLSLAEAVVGRVADILEASDAKLDALSAEIFLDDEAPRGGTFRLPPPRPDLRRVLGQIGRVGALAAKLRQSLLGMGRMLAFFRQSSVGIRLPDETRGRIAELESDVRSLADHDAQQSATVAFLLEATLGLIDIEQSKIIKTFTIASVALMPPTLVASIYGMNFEHMPELKWQFGYPLSLIVMVASALLPVWYFRRRGWL